MGTTTERVVLLAAGYLLGRSKKSKLALMVAGSVAYGRLSGRKDGESSGSITDQVTRNPEQQRVSSGISEAARETVNQPTAEAQDTDVRSAAPEDQQETAEEAERRAPEATEEPAEKPPGGDDRQAIKASDDENKEPARQRYRKMTPAKVRHAINALGGGADVGELCEEIGLTRRTLYRYVSPDGELRLAGQKLLNRE